MLLIGIFLFSLFVGTPMAFVLAITALAAFFISGYPIIMIPQRIFSGLDSFTLMAVPFFILAGGLMNSGGITRRLICFSDYLVGRIKGGLAHTNIVVSMFFAGISGAAVADTAAIGKVLIPAMIEKGFDKDFSTAVTASSSTIGPIIPPSIIMVIYGITMNVSIGGLFLAGYIPGVLIGLSLMLVAYIYSIKRNYPRRETKITFNEFLNAFKQAILPLFAPLIIVGGILFGIFTPTEAASIAVLFSFIVSFFIYKELSWSDLPEILLDTVLVTGSVLIIFGAASSLAWFISVEQINKIISQFIINTVSSKYVFLLVINILLLFIGTLIDAGAAIIIFAPVLAPIAIQMGVHPLHFGFIVVLNLVIGLITPPLGICLFVACGVARLKVTDLVKAIWPFVLVEIAVLFLVTYFPIFTMFLPKLFGFY